MPLLPGTRFGAYEIVGPLGAGGMGEVYRAKDPRLNRHVALKLLPEGVAADPERRERFLREGQSVAALNHPHIVTIYSVEETGGVPFLTLELVEGKPLSDHVRKGGLPLDILLRLAIPIADAVSFAHQQGILHRDLKPSNIMVTADGRPKVLDFGLAKLTDTEPAVAAVTDVPTAHLTGEGRILGTAAYMSPEQAEGRPVDHRSDIFSLGIVLYEMATGERPFKGDTAMSTISSILKDKPRPATELNPTIPREIGRVIRRCLTKDAEHRFQSAKDLRNELEEIREELQSGELPAQPAAVRRPSGSRNIAIAGGGLIVALLVGAGAFVVWRGRSAGNPTSGPPLTGTVRQLTTQAGVEATPSLSPDGSWVIYSAEGPRGDTDIFLQGVGAQTPINLTPDSAAGDSQPAFSPNGESIAFRSGRGGGGLFVMGRTGESVRRITDRGFHPAWSPDGKELLFSTQAVGNPFGRSDHSELWVANIASGERRRVSSSDAVHGSWSPSGGRIAYWGLRGNTTQRDLFTIPASGGEPVAVTDDPFVDWSPIWSADGRFLYFSSNRSGVMSLWRIAIDEASGRPLGEAAPLAAPGSFTGNLTRSADGRRLAYGSVVFDANVYRVGFDPVRGVVQGEPAEVTRGSVTWAYLDVSPDGTSIVMSPQVRQEDLYVARTDGTGGSRQVTNDPALDRWPRWSRDGSQLLFYSTLDAGATNIWTIRPDGSGRRALTQSASHALYPVWSPDGRVAYTELSSGEIRILDPAKPPGENVVETIPPFEDGRNVATAHWSPDGRKLLLTKGGIIEYSFDQRTYQRLLPGGGRPRWLSDSRRIVFSQGTRLRLLDTATKQVSDLLTMDRQGLGNVALTADDRSIYFTRQVNEGDIYLIEFPGAPSPQIRN